MRANEMQILEHWAVVLYFQKLLALLLHQIRHSQIRLPCIGESGWGQGWSLCWGWGCVSIEKPILVLLRPPFRYLQSFRPESPVLYMMNPSRYKRMGGRRVRPDPSTHHHLTGLAYFLVGGHTTRQM